MECYRVGVQFPLSVKDQIILNRRGEVKFIPVCGIPAGKIVVGSGWG